MVRDQRDEGGAWIYLDTAGTQSNGTNVFTVDATGGGAALAPSSVGTSTVNRWLKIDIGGVGYYIPMWT